MNAFLTKQRGFAMPAMFIAAAITFFASLNLKSEDGTTVAEAMGFNLEKKTDFAAVEAQQETNSTRLDE